MPSQFQTIECFILFFYSPSSCCSVSLCTFVCAHLGKHPDIQLHSKTNDFFFTLSQIPQGLYNYFFGFSDGRLSVLGPQWMQTFTWSWAKRKKKKTHLDRQNRIKLTDCFLPSASSLLFRSTERCFLWPYLLSRLHLAGISNPSHT